MGEPTGLADEQLRALGQLTSISANRDYYLAGGSAIACHLAHRVSRDLDLFSRRPDVNLEDVPRALRENNATVEVVAITDVTLAMRVDGCLVDVVRYPYGLIEPVSEGPLGFPMAGLLDLSTMKLAAIVRRGIRRDFWDLHEIFARTPLTLRDALHAYRQKFGVAESDVYHVVRSLTYFVDAENEPLPVGLSSVRWTAIKVFFEGTMASRPWE